LSLLWLDKVKVLEININVFDNKFQ